MARSLPWYRLIAEAESFPLASEASFAWGGTALSREEDFGPAGATADLAERFGEHLRTRAAGLSLDAIDSLRDRVWFPPGTGNATTTPLHALVHCIAAEYIGWEGTHVSLRCPVGMTNLPERAAAWRWLTLRAPDDLFVAAAVAPTPHEYPHGHVRLLSPQLARMLEEDGASETHLHLGGALSTSVLWSAMAASLHRASRDADFRALAPLRPIPFGEVGRFLAVLRAAMCVRLVMTAFLDAHPAGDHVAFDAWLMEYADGLSSPPRAIVDGVALGDALRELLAGFRDGRALDPVVTREVYAALLGGSAPAAAYDMDAARGYDLPDLWQAGPDPDRRTLPIIEDPLTRRAPRADRVNLRVEGVLALRGLRWLSAAEARGRRADEAASGFARLFWQYQRVRGIFHRFLTPEPGTAGLDWFSRHFQRVSTFSRPVADILPALALRHAGSSLRLASFEGRLAPPTPSDSLRAALRWFLDGALSIREAQRPEVALLLHFLKSHRSRDDAQGPKYGDPWGDVRYRRWYRARRPELAAIRALLVQSPEVLAVLRGLDVASRELAIPTWVIAAVLNAGREASRHAAAELSRRHPEWAVPPMRVTVHAGEDFRRLSDGLRRIGELIRYGCVGAGDRIGHGIALGTDPVRWAERYTVMGQPREERLDDLLWELALYDDGSLPGEGARVAAVRAEAKQHVRAIYEDEEGSPLPSLEDLIEVRALLHRAPGAEVLDAARDGLDIPAGVPSRLRRTFERYLTERSVYLRSVVPIAVEANDGEVRALQAMQRFLRAQLGRLEVTVESNPSSNLLIGDLEDLTDHPAMRLAPLDDPAGLQEPAVLLSLNSDDPVTFATSLADEYAHMYFALLRSKVPSARALRWLSTIQRNGWRSRFSLPVSRDTEVLHTIYRALLPPTLAR